MNAHEFEFTTIDGDRLALSDFVGKAILIVNTASECGYTPQYSALQQLWQTYRAQGLVVIGVPSNDFGAQEPGSEAEIKAFCTQNYGVDFPMTSKQTVVGTGAHPFYRAVADAFGGGAVPIWNFHKYLINLAGEIVEIWPSQVDPLSEEIKTVIDKILRNPHTDPGSE
jgi:glutathione peroxidase